MYLSVLLPSLQILLSPSSISSSSVSSDSVSVSFSEAFYAVRSSIGCSSEAFSSSWISVEDSLEVAAESVPETTVPVATSSGGVTVWLGDSLAEAEPWALVLLADVLAEVPLTAVSAVAVSWSIWSGVMVFSAGEVLALLDSV